MDNYTHATVVISDADKAQAILDMGIWFFTAGMSASGTLPATHWISSWPFLNNELDAIANTYTWAKKMYFGADSMEKIIDLSKITE